MSCFSVYEQRIASHLSHYQHETAIFLAEQLHAAEDNDDSMHLLAKCYMQSGSIMYAQTPLQHVSLNEPNCCAGDILRAWSLLQRSDRTTLSDRNLYLLAYCSFKLDKFEEAKGCLLPLRSDQTCVVGTHASSRVHVRSGSTRSARNPVIALLQGGAHGLYLLGCMFRSHQSKKAARYFHMALVAEPTMFSAFEVRARRTNAIRCCITTII